MYSGERHPTKCSDILWYTSHPSALIFLIWFVTYFTQEHIRFLNLFIQVFKSLCRAVVEYCQIKVLWKEVFKHEMHIWLNLKGGIFTLACNTGIGNMLFIHSVYSLCSCWLIPPFKIVTFITRYFCEQTWCFDFKVTSTALNQTAMCDICWQYISNTGFTCKNSTTLMLTVLVQSLVSVVFAQGHTVFVLLRCNIIFLPARRKGQSQQCVHQLKRIFQPYDQNVYIFKGQTLNLQGDKQSPAPTHHLNSPAVSKITNLSDVCVIRNNSLSAVAGWNWRLAQNCGQFIAWGE